MEVMEVMKVINKVTEVTTSEAGEDAIHESFDTLIIVSYKMN